MGRGAVVRLRSGESVEGDKMISDRQPQPLICARCGHQECRCAIPLRMSVPAPEAASEPPDPHVTDYGRGEMETQKRGV